MKENRFSENMEEDRLFRLAAPHYEEAQLTIAKLIKNEASFAGREILRILEIGCGTGLTTEIILKANSRVNLIAIDNDVQIIEAARSRFESSDQGRLSILAADALEYIRTQDNESLDAVVSALTFHNWQMSYRNEVYAEIYRVLKKGGLFINVDKIAQDDALEHQKALDWQIEQFKVFDKYNRPELRRKWEQHYSDDEDQNLLLTENDYVNDLKVNGFREIQLLYRNHMEASYLAKK